MCMLFEYCQLSLHRFLSKYPGEIPLTHVKCIGYQLIQALDALAKANLVHGDLKPDNIMMKRIGSLEIKIVDFGFSFDNGKVRFLYY